MSNNTNEQENDSDNQVARLRQKFLDEYHSNPELYDERDLDQIRTSDFVVARFLNFLNQGPIKGFEHMKDCYQWRKSSGVNDFDTAEFNQEYQTSGVVFPYLPDREGLSVIHLRPKICNKLKADNAEKLEKYCMMVINAVDSHVRKEFGWGIVMNCHDIGVSDVDLNFIFHILPKLRKYFPNGCKYCVIYGLHWSVNYVCKIALAAMPADSAKKIRFYGKQQELNDLIDPDNLPDYLNGNATKEYRKYPSLLTLNQ